MKRNQAIKMLRQWHEECIKAAKNLPAPFHAIVEEQERTYNSGTAFQYEAVVWNEDAMDRVTVRRWDNIYHFRSDEENTAIFNEKLEAFKADVAKVIEEHKKQHAA